MDTNLRSILIGAGVAAALFLGYSFRPVPQPATFTYRQFSTIESVVPGGLGRSRMIISDDASQEVGKDLLNFYSLTGINFKNVASNDRLIVDNMKRFLAGEPLMNQVNKHRGY